MGSYQVFKALNFKLIFSFTVKNSAQIKYIHVNKLFLRVIDFVLEEVESKESVNDTSRIIQVLPLFDIELLH